MQVLNDKRKKETSIFNIIKYIYKRIINLISISLFRGKSNDDKVQRKQDEPRNILFKTICDIWGANIDEPQNIKKHKTKAGFIRRNMQIIIENGLENST